MIQSSGFGAGSNYLGYVSTPFVNTSQNVSGLGAGSNYLGYVSPDSAQISGADPWFPILRDFWDQIRSSYSEDARNAKDAVQNAVDSVLSSQDPSNPDTPSPPSAGGLTGLPLDPASLDYLYADLAKHYGMSKETAYQEALSNTSYQRAIKDMQAAGLNPAAIFGSGKASGADGVSYVSSAAPSGAGGSTGRSTSKNKDNLFSSGAYYGLSAGIGLLAGILTKSPTGYWIGSQASQGFLGAANAVYKSMK